MGASSTLIAHRTQPGCCCSVLEMPRGVFQQLSNLVLQELNANLSNLTSAFEKATAEKIKCQQEADATNRVILLANRYWLLPETTLLLSDP